MVQVTVGCTMAAKSYRLSTRRWMGAPGERQAQRKRSSGGPIIRGGYQGPKEVSYLFVDGGYLRGVCEKFSVEWFDSARLSIDYQALGHGFTKCFYYDCLPLPRAGEDEAANESRRSEQRAELNAIKALHGWHVVEGVLAGSGGRTRQKQVDVQIAVDMLTHSYRGNMHSAAFIAGDQDFKPLVEAVVREGMFIEIWFEKSSASTDLLDSADGRRPLDLYGLHGYLDKGFRESHPLPQRWIQGDRSIGSARLLKKGTCAEGIAELYEGDGEYILIRPSQRDSDQLLHMTHPGLDYLERVAALLEGEITW